MKYYSCPMIEGFALNFNGSLEHGQNCMTLCCENIIEKPSTMLCDTPGESLEGFRRIRAELIAESIRLELIGIPEVPRHFTSGCAKCANFQLGEFNGGDGHIHFVNLSMYPAPCQSKCIYCGVHKGESGIFNKSLHAEYYERLFDLLEYAKHTGVLAPDANWQISSGEIAIHPYREQILRLVKNKQAMFYTNCFIFDELIAENLSSNPHSSINLSIDSGTPETWKKIKGVDNFEIVTDNLVKYFKSSKPGQITLKYIILPGINDNYSDYKSVVDIMKVLGVSHLTLARDTRIKYTLDKGLSKDLIGAAGYFVAILHKNGLTTDMYTYTPDERKSIINFAANLLKKGEV